jgi:hypothetical protein
MVNGASSAALSAWPSVKKPAATAKKIREVIAEEPMVPAKLGQQKRERLAMRAQTALA